jgi:hypothetical protein
MNYEEAKAYQPGLINKNTSHSDKLGEFDREGNGLVSEHVKILPEFQEAKKEFNSSFAELRNFNSWFIKTFKKEYSIERSQRYKKA